MFVERRAAEPIIPLKLFRSSVFRVASSLGFLIGLAMFGAIIFIPLFLQLVYGVSPTSSGLRMLPLMAGLLAASILVRPRDQPDRPLQGVPDRRHRGDDARDVPAVAAGGRHARRGWPRSTCSSSASGSASTMQVLVLVVQNDAPPKDIGVATSTATFFRSMGGSLGVALFGAIFAARLNSELPGPGPSIASGSPAA